MTFPFVGSVGSRRSCRLAQSFPLWPGGQRPQSTAVVAAAAASWGTRSTTKAPKSAPMAQSAAGGMFPRGGARVGEVRRRNGCVGVCTGDAQRDVWGWGWHPHHHGAPFPTPVLAGMSRLHLVGSLHRWIPASLDRCIFASCTIVECRRFDVREVVTRGRDLQEGDANSTTRRESNNIIGSSQECTVEHS